MIDKIISMAGNDHYLYKDKDRAKQNLIDDLQKYGNLKLAIKNIIDKKKKINLKAGKKTGHQQLHQKQKRRNIPSTSKDINKF